MHETEPEVIITAPPAGAGGFDAQAAGQIARIDPDKVGAIAVAERERAEIQSAIAIAKSYPRDEAAAYARIMRAADRPAFAEGALYQFPRAGSTVEGPSVKLAREAARCWGNIRSGVRVMSATGERTHLMGYALDLESNTFTSLEVSFKNLIYRKRGGWVQPDERDYAEMVNRYGAKAERNAILKLIPPDIIDEVERKVKEAQVKAARGEIEQDREASIRRLVAAFVGYGVSREMLEAKVGHPLQTIQAEEIANLRRIWTSLKDGHSLVDEHFERPAAPQPQTREADTADLDALAASLTKDEKKAGVEGAANERPEASAA